MAPPIVNWRAQWSTILSSVHSTVFVREDVYDEAIVSALDFTKYILSVRQFRALLKVLLLLVTEFGFESELVIAVLAKPIVVDSDVKVLRIAFIDLLLYLLPLRHDLRILLRLLFAGSNACSRLLRHVEPFLLVVFF